MAEKDGARMPASMRMLIVDDEDSICDFLSTFFGSRFEVQTAPNAEEARNFLAAGRFDIMLVDKNLPGMSGVDLIAKVRESDEELSIVMITGFASSESIVETLNLGIDAYVEKPFKSLSELAQLVDAILRRKTVPVPGRFPAARGSLRSQRNPERPPEPPRPPRVVGAIGDIQRRVDIIAALSTLNPSITCVGTERELLKLMATDPDAVLLDTDAWPGWSPKIVDQVANKAPFAACIVLTAASISTTALKGLVGIGVRSVILWNTDAQWKSKLSESVRRAVQP